MLRVFAAGMSREGGPGRPRRHRFTPTLSERASRLEDRVLLSAMGGNAHAAEVAGNPAETRAGKEVTKLFESILQTRPTAAQLSRMVHRLHDGLSVAALRRDLAAEAGATGGTNAPVNTTIIGGGQPATATAAMRPATGGVMMSIQEITSRSNPTGPDVVQRGLSQVPPGMRIAATSSPGPGRTSGGGPAAGSTPARPTPSSPAMSPMPTMVGMSPSSGMSSPAMGSTMTMMSSTAATVGSTSSIFAGIGTPAMLPISPMPVAPFSATSVMSTGM